MRAPEYYLGKPIRSLQTMLRQISEYDSRILPVIPDGFYGRSTYASVRSFQQAFDLPDTGETDAATWNSIVEAHDQILPEIQAPVIIPVWPTERSVKPGEANHHLVLAQAMLWALSGFFPALKPPSVNGRLDSTTEAGLRWLQQAANLPSSGALDAPTWHVLNGLYRIMVGDGTAFQEITAD